MVVIGLGIHRACSKFEVPWKRMSSWVCLGGLTQFGAKPPLFVSLEARRPGTESEVRAETSRKLQSLVNTIFGTLAGDAALDTLMDGIDFSKHTLHDVLQNLHKVA